jgi:hypothetical protein
MDNFPNLGMKSTRKMVDSKQHFLLSCHDYIKSMEVAIQRKANGSTVEDGYFVEKINKLKEYFLGTEVE